MQREIEGQHKLILLTDPRQTISRGMDTELIDLLRSVAGGFHGRMQQFAACEAPGLTEFQARLVNLIGRCEGISQMDIGTRIGRDKAQIARTVRELETLGLVCRSAHPSDWRAKCLALTDQGKSVHGRLAERRRQISAQASEVLSDEERQCLQAALRKLAAALQDRQETSQPD